MKETLLIIVICFTLFSLKREVGRYQLASVGNGKAIVLDTLTSEVWESTGEINLRTNYFYPMRYDIQLKNNLSLHQNLDFTAEEGRDKDHASWWTLFKRRFLSI